MGGLSALTAILLVIPYFLRFAVAWVWNLILFILWMALFGLFASVCLYPALLPICPPNGIPGAWPCQTTDAWNIDVPQREPRRQRRYTADEELPVGRPRQRHPLAHHQRRRLHLLVETQR